MNIFEVLLLMAAIVAAAFGLAALQQWTAQARRRRRFHRAKASRRGHIRDDMGSGPAPPGDAEDVPTPIGQELSADHGGNDK